LNLQQTGSSNIQQTIAKRIKMNIILTKIEKIKKNRYALYAQDNTFMFDVDEDTLVHFTLSKGQGYSQNEMDEIHRYDQFINCLHQAYRYLERRPHLKKELARKLKQKEYSERIITQTIDYLLEKKYLDDLDYIRRFISDQIRLKRNGFLLIKKKLMEKGARQEDSERLLLLHYSEKMQISNAKALYEKKRATLKDYDSPKTKQKLIKHLQQKGFPWKIIESALE
jgi:regulatory protein